MKRRSFLTGSITIPALGVGIAAGAAAKDPHPEWLDQWRALRADWLLHEDGSDAAERILERGDELERNLMETMPATLAGIAAQIQFALEDRLVGEVYRGGVFDGLDERMFRNIAATLDAAA
ncbi:hypothetical protein [Phaeobacter gallaeciensis]|uniref:Uncharacterized protein n=1 Tax=Phaeobacter gallaeciensis TaxID=60890 RepID=A0AAD0EDA3_9RHOB|nr:hypothetical protein [Phaeobacter gallaeciensis]AHD09995.1 hypothetical protein Gal_02248 [Phaeobacter gallaeciensis DSM 26640]ATE93259.1 hypothetical protein PhaeoP11_02239 [Phaeobacter gallaeciensis]ATE96920.1 hypothetical protein PhaeoP73_01608 [Phaeobacter gallaeciensis]ATF01923.1 hypothetical protein PhaeoP75_02288 [Phaeobacter gallaeciensis]ATF06303.1 hypothetical protein PhaeoP63_02237 [Phaeobacter gallaeciensis]